MPAFKASIHLTSTSNHRNPAFLSHSLDFAEVPSKNDPDFFYHTTVRAWVPVPQHHLHAPGIFLSLKNAAGYCYARCTPADYSQVLLNLTSWKADLTSAYEKAEVLSQTYISALSKKDPFPQEPSSL